MARIKEEDIDALRERADIAEIIGGYSKLKRSGHTFKGLCPFHSEKTPSLQINPSNGLWHCFGCGAGGNVYQFVQRIENLPFPEAVEWLARKTGFQLRYEELKPGERKAAGVKARLIAANESAARFLHEQLLTSADAAGARRYLEWRGFGREVAERWKLGYGPGRNALCRHLLSHGFSPAEIEQAGLARRSERDGALYDFFRERIIFPTWSLQGDVVGFGGRALGDESPKYINSPDTPVFSKSRLLFGLDRAKSAIARGVAVLVEGYTDVIALHEAGVTEAVATNGVALGEAHFELLKKFTQRAVLMLDADEAGKGATERSFGVHHRIGLEVLVAPLPDGRDPAEVVGEDGSDAIRKVLEGAQPLLLFKLEEMIAKLVLDTPEARARAVRQVVEVLRWHPDPIARHEYAFMAAQRIGVEPDAIQRALGEQSRPSGSREGIERGQERRLPGHVKVEREALQLVLTRPETAVRYASEVDDKDFTSAPRRELFRHAVDASRAGVTSVAAKAAEQLSSDALALLTELTVGGEMSGDDLSERSEEVFVRLKVFALERDIKKRRDVLQDVNPLDDPQRHDELFTELVSLEANRRDLLRRLQGAA
ncbi:MAG: DNA primase [Actinomycetota bacterium]